MSFSVLADAFLHFRDLSKLAAARWRLQEPSHRIAFCTCYRSIRSFAIVVLINLDIFYLLFIFLYSFRCICLPLGE